MVGWVWIAFWIGACLGEGVDVDLEGKTDREIERKKEGL